MNAIPRNHEAAEALNIASGLVAGILKHKRLSAEAAVALLGLTFDSILNGTPASDTNHAETAPAVAEAKAETMHDASVAAPPPAMKDAGASRPQPAVPIKKSITKDWIICLEDGKRCKMLKRHLTHIGMTPAQYRAKWGLPDDYPMTAPSYAKSKSDFAMSVGLGTIPNKQGMTREQTMAALSHLAETRETVTA